MPRRPSTPYHHGDLRQSLLRIAAQILKDRGLNALSLRTVAHRAGVSHQAPYHHFPTRDHLLAALAAEGFTTLGDELDHVQAGVKDPVAAARESGVRYVTFAAEDPERFRLMFGAHIASREAYPDLEAAALRVFATLVRPFGLTLGSIRGDPQPVVLTLWSAVHGLAALAVDGQVTLRGKALENAARETTRHVWVGVGEILNRGRDRARSRGGISPKRPTRR